MSDWDQPKTQQQMDMDRRRAAINVLLWDDLRDLGEAIQARLRSVEYRLRVMAERNGWRP